ncbi:MAG: tetratricopeptide repeat protein [Candidatus Cloacimonetes bacterium]|nr:tetratricopeptide repeat protein [Candidatus Cloacimonadota bacterium]
MIKKINLIILLTVFGIFNFLYAEKSFERLGNEAEFSGDEFFNAKNYLKAADKYKNAIFNFQEAKKKDGIPIDEKITNIDDKLYKSFYFAGSFSKAIEILKRINGRSYSLKTTKLIAQIYQKNMKQTDAAITYLIAENSKQRKFILEKKIALYYLKLEKKRKALSWFIKSYELKKDPGVIKNIATLYYQLGDNKSAVQAYEDFLKTNPSEAATKKTYKNMAVLYEQMNKISKATECYEKYLTYDYKKDINMKLIDLYYEAENYTSSLSKIKQLLKKYPNNCDAVYYRAMINYNRENKVAAKSDFNILLSCSNYKKAAKKFIESIDSE